jgi:hypothetical protein
VGTDKGRAVTTTDRARGLSVDKRWTTRENGRKDVPAGCEQSVQPRPLHLEKPALIRQRLDGVEAGRVEDRDDLFERKLKLPEEEYLLKLDQFRLFVAAVAVRLHV